MRLIKPARHSSTSPAHCGTVFPLSVKNSPQKNRNVTGYACMQWVTHTPEGSFATVCNGDRYAEMVRSQGGENALKQWKQLEDKMRPLQQGAALFPAAALRSDPGDT